MLLPRLCILYFHSWILVLKELVAHILVISLLYTGTQLHTIGLMAMFVIFGFYILGRAMSYQFIWIRSVLVLAVVSQLVIDMDLSFLERQDFHWLFDLQNCGTNSARLLHLQSLQLDIIHFGHQYPLLTSRIRGHLLYLKCTQLNQHCQPKLVLVLLTTLTLILAMFVATRRLLVCNKHVKRPTHGLQ